MSALPILQEQWDSLLARLPRDFDLDQRLRESGGLKRRRAIDHASTLLRLALIYGISGLSLRATAAWAEAQGLARLSDVALLKRLRGASGWLGELLGAVLAERLEKLDSLPASYQLRVIDATTARIPGSRGTDYRVHLGLDLSRLRIDRIEVTGPSGGESFSRLAIRPGELILADRGYAHCRGLAAVRRAEADYLVRIHWQNLPLQDERQNRLDLVALADSVPAGQPLELAVWITSSKAPAAASGPARLILARKSEEAAEAERRKIRKEASRKGRQVDPRSLKMAGFFTVLTSVPQQDLSTSQVLELYRLRWQIEMTFKRIKGLLDLGNLPAKDPQLVQSYLYAKLLAALLLEDLTEDLLAFSPSGSPKPGATGKPVANPANLTGRVVFRRARPAEL